ncbi:TolB-like translocation protein [Cyclonatronum proteinivorum]|nr:hypothetical protein [Cyclonatronum proteinivorum]
MMVLRAVLWLLFGLFGCAVLPAVFRAGGASAQVYENVHRPKPDLRQLDTPRFRVIFPAGEESAAFRTARILEDQYPIIKSLVGGELRRFPVVLNAHNDLSNGYVTPLHFRTEIEIPAIKGPALNPRTGGWIENVAPHELVHALHFSNIPDNSIPRLVYTFWPDMGRAMHGAAPFGMIEGIAVFHESNVVYGSGGRGNYSLFRDQTRAMLAGDAPWSLAQHLNPAFYSFPGNRHYTAGFEFINWLQYTYGMETTRQSIEYFVRYPFFGYGAALRHATGSRTGALYRAYLSEIRAALDPVPESVTATAAITLPKTAEDAHIGRAVWLDNARILFAQGTQYNSRPGFYVAEASGGTPRLLLETRQVGDFRFSLTPDRRHLLYSRYHSHPWFENTHIMDVYHFETDTRRLQRLTEGARLHAPAFAPGSSGGFSGDVFPGFTALQTDSETSRLVRVSEGGAVTELVRLKPDTWVQAEPSPAEAGRWAVIANRNGIQALWLVEGDDFGSVTGRNPDVGFRNGVVLDAAWAADGESVLLSGWMRGTESAQVYRFFPAENELVQLTNEPFGATSPDLRPDGGALLYIAQEGQSRVIRVLAAEHFGTRSFQPFDFQPELQDRFAATRLSDYREADLENWTLGAYRTGFDWLRPRGVVPVLELSERSRESRFGVMMSGGDVLRQHSWQAELTISDRRLWAEMFYRNTTFYPGWQMEAYYRPRFTNAGLFTERGGEVSLPFFGRIEDRSRNSFWQFRPGIAAREFRYTDDLFIRPGQPGFDGWFTDVSLKGFAALYWRWQQNIRDIMPNTGTVLFVQGEQFVYSDRDEGVQGMRFGVNQYLSPWLSRNHGLMLGAEGLTQTRTLLYGTSGLVYDGFETNILAGARNAAVLRARYALPLRYVDDGFISVPFFLDRVYLALQANYVLDLNAIDGAPLTTAGRAVYGIELRTSFRLYNLPLDIGLGLGWEPTRGKVQVFGNTR